jgi:hypothetical protein
MPPRLSRAADAGRARVAEPDSGPALPDRLGSGLLLIELRLELLARVDSEGLFQEPAGLPTLAADKAHSFDLRFALR